MGAYMQTHQRVFSIKIWYEKLGMKPNIFAALLHFIGCYELLRMLNLAFEKKTARIKQLDRSEIYFPFIMNTEIGLNWEWTNCIDHLKVCLTITKQSVMAAR